jgi:LPS O-antigen subunit length determinant protein (WzzB/FepE family)
LGGLASLAGVSVGGGEISESQIAQEIMQSWSFIDSFIAENDLAVEVYAAEGWSKGSNELLINQDAYDRETGEWLTEDSDGNIAPPTSWQLFQKFSGMLSVSEDKKSGLVSVSIEYYSPQIAKEWLDLYVSAINEHMQSRQVAKVSNNISYLEAQIDKTSIAEMREVFYTIIEEQTKNKMVAEASPDYAFVAVSPSMVPEEKSQPKRALICILGTLLGGILSVLLVLVNHYARGSDNN